MGKTFWQNSGVLGVWLAPCFAVYGFNVALYEFLHIILLDYIPFLILLFTLFTVAGGVRLTGSLVGTPLVNTALLAVGTVLASWMGTTGAAMLLIRPLLRVMPTANTACTLLYFYLSCLISAVHSPPWAIRHCFWAF